MSDDGTSPATGDDFGILIQSIQKNRRQRIDVRVNEYKGTTFLDIREYFLHRESGEWRPGRKGIAVRDELYPELLRAVADAAELLGFADPDGP